MSALESKKIMLQFFNMYAWPSGGALADNYTFTFCSCSPKNNPDAQTQLNRQVMRTAPTNSTV